MGRMSQSQLANWYASQRRHVGEDPPYHWSEQCGWLKLKPEGNDSAQAINPAGNGKKNSKNMNEVKSGVDVGKIINLMGIDR